MRSKRSLLQPHAEEADDARLLTPNTLPTPELDSPLQWACAVDECCECVPAAVAEAAEAAAASAQALFSDPRPLFDSIRADATLLQRLAAECLAYTMSHGITMLKPAAAASSDGPSLIHAPVTLLPHVLPRAVFQQTQALASDFNVLYERVSRDVPWLLDTLKSTAELDPFLRRLLDMLRRVHAEPTKQAIQLAINRSDYLMHSRKPADDEEHREQEVQPLQVEFNCISAGAGSLSNRVSDMHRFLIKRYVESAAPVALDRGEPSSSSSPSPSAGAGFKLDLPPNDVIAHLASAMAQAHGMFLRQQVALDARSAAAMKSAVILFVVQEVEANMSDQRLIEYVLFEAHGLPVVRMTLDEVARFTSTDEAGRLWINQGPQPQMVSLAYFRAGYTPRDFTKESQWEALERIERSAAIKCPSLSYHLSGTKKVQQVLAAQGVVERFVDADQARRIRASFAGLWTPTEESIARALTNPDDFVLKPQREGGGNNHWGAELVEMLQTKSVEELQPYILMSRIRTLPHPSSALKFSKLVLVANAMSELGMMGATITSLEWTQGGQVSSVKFHRNEYVGYLLRTKDSALNEGGLMSGIGAVDSLVLLP